MHTRITQKHRVKIKAMQDGLGIIIPSRQELATLWKKCVYGAALFVLTLLTGGAFVLARYIFIETGEWDAVILLGGMFVIPPLLAEIKALYDFFGQERVLLRGDMLSIEIVLLGLRKRKRYHLSQVANIRHARTSLLFDYYHSAPRQPPIRTIKCCTGIDRQGMTTADARSLATHLSEIQRFRCHQVTHILFGPVPNVAGDSEVCLQNPNVSDLSFPFVYLRRISIATSGYDFHQVERFLTYAVNVLGTTHMKEIDVHIFGAPEAMHPNLWNNFEYLCKNIHVHTVKE